MQKEDLKKLTVCFQKKYRKITYKNNSRAFKSIAQKRNFMNEDINKPTTNPTPASPIPPTASTEENKPAGTTPEQPETHK